MEERIKKLASLTHKDRVHEYNKKLEALSEHHDIPKASADLDVALSLPGLKYPLRLAPGKIPNFGIPDWFPGVLQGCGFAVFLALTVYLAYLEALSKLPRGEMILFLRKLRREMDPRRCRFVVII